jgi:hypothetical protein
VYSLKPVGSDTFSMRCVSIPSLKGMYQCILVFRLVTRRTLKIFIARNYLELRRLYTRLDHWAVVKMVSILDLLRLCISNFDLENMFLSEACLNLSNLRQNLLLENVLSMRYYARTKALFSVLNRTNLAYLFLKNKIFGL